VHGLRAAYSIGHGYLVKIAGWPMRWYEQRYMAMRKGVFHLTGRNAESVLSCMTGSSKERTEIKRSGAIARLYERSHKGWRKVATAAAALLTLGMGYHIIFGQNGLTAYQQKRQDAQSLDRQLHSLQKENDQLKGHVDRLKSDPNAIEHQAREELHYTRPGEVIYTLPATPSAPGAASEPASAK
jgi:cell division protein FtsB